MKRSRHYIPAPEFWKEMFVRPSFEGCWTLADRVQIGLIRIDKSLFAFQNEVDLHQVESMAENFDIDLWIPIMVNEGYFLLDGQHRLKTAQRLGLKYIDVVIEHTEKLRVSRNIKKQRKGLPQENNHG